MDFILYFCSPFSLFLSLSVTDFRKIGHWNMLSFSFYFCKTVPFIVNKLVIWSFYYLLVFYIHSDLFTKMKIRYGSVGWFGQSSFTVGFYCARVPIYHFIFMQIHCVVRVYVCVAYCYRISIGLYFFYIVLLAILITNVIEWIMGMCISNATSVINLFKNKIGFSYLPFISYWYTVNWTLKGCF